MKILLCTNAFENITNGPAKFANLVLQINDRYPQHQIRILTEDVSESRLTSLKYVYKVTLNYPGFLRLFGQFLRMFIYYNKAKQIQKEYDYDVLVYINSFNGLWASLVSDKPTIGMINDDNNLRTNFKNFTNQRWAKKIIFKYLEKLSAKHHKGIISNSDYLTQQILKAYSLPSTRVTRLYKSIDLDNTTFQPHREFKQPIRVLFIKADYIRGGLTVLAAALQSLQPLTFELTIIGPSQGFGNHISSIFKDTTNTTVHFLGEQPQATVFTLLTTQDIFCVPSLQEALGVANIEALAYGIPVVSTKAGGIPEVLDNGNNGWMAVPGNPLDLASALQACIQNTEQRLQKSINGRRYIERFSAPYMFKEFLRILEECK
ncbi:glycosyltransferase family 4 protein [Rhodocytophaga aerolata]|uniref:Glycosyltransferase family 4 protein n=1 Tax=Rhodocytophaga aerolata TaxID=455078 RepID=A0ABT8R6P9_9BACT|nr:glycosyltransferase family 4 protein [Rhodocytophaga aerolata]MDO1446948.1 glycosyltransferase family 4 protein [Rhodocytophaga aerolata]